MKKIRFAGILALGLLCVSCYFTEEIHLNGDGSGSIALQFDGSGWMSDSTLMGGRQTRIDSVIRFAEVLEQRQDLSPEEREQLEQLRPYQMRMISDPETGEGSFTLSREFRDIGEVGDTFNAFQNAGALDKEKGGIPMGASKESQPGTEVSYSFSGGRFTRRSVIVDSVLHQQRLDSLAGGDSFLVGSAYKLQIHFPSRVKSVNQDKATLSIDGKTLYLEADLVQYLKSPEVLDLEVELEQ